MSKAGTETDVVVTVNVKLAEEMIGDITGVVSKVAEKVFGEAGKGETLLGSLAKLTLAIDTLKTQVTSICRDILSKISIVESSVGNIIRNLEDYRGKAYGEDIDIASVVGYMRSIQARIGELIESNVKAIGDAKDVINIHIDSVLSYVKDLKSDFDEFVSNVLTSFDEIKDYFELLKMEEIKPIEFKKEIVPEIEEVKPPEVTKTMIPTEISEMISRAEKSIETNIGTIERTLKGEISKGFIHQVNLQIGRIGTILKGIESAVIIKPHSKEGRTYGTGEDIGKLLTDLISKLRSDLNEKLKELILSFRERLPEERFTTIMSLLREKILAE